MPKELYPSNMAEYLLMAYCLEQGLVDDDEDMIDLENKIDNWKAFYEWMKKETP